MGGATPPIEAKSVYEHDRALKVTGQLGDVMQELREKIAMSVVESVLEDYGVTKDFFAKRHIHLHVPEGATPKDGPSAGITMASALPLATNKKPNAAP